MVQPKKKNTKKDKASETSENVGNATPPPQANVETPATEQTATQQKVPPQQQDATQHMVPPQQQVSQVQANDGSQGGVFRQKKPATKVKNTPHGIQPRPTNSKNKVTTTSRENIEARRREMQSKLRENPVWKI